VKIRLVNGLVFDGHRPDLIADHVVGVSDGRIVHFSKDPWDERVDREIDLRGRVLMPGLIDAHYHAYAGINNHVQLEELPVAYLAHHARISLEGSLRRGFTSVRDAAGADYGLWRATEEGLFDAPRLFFGTKRLARPAVTAMCGRHTWQAICADAVWPLAFWAGSLMASKTCGRPLGRSCVKGRTT